MLKYKLRPHHILCTSFFEGKGYSSSFTANMADVIAILDEDDPIVSLIIGQDLICKSCPNCAYGHCIGNKAERFDKAVLRILGLNEDSAARWSELKIQVQKSIINSGKLAEICHDCQWFSICSNAAIYRGKHF